MPTSVRDIIEKRLKAELEAQAAQRQQAEVLERRLYDEGTALLATALREVCQTEESCRFGLRLERNKKDEAFIVARIGNNSLTFNGVVALDDGAVVLQHVKLVELYCPVCHQVHAREKGARALRVTDENTLTEGVMALLNNCYTTLEKAILAQEKEGAA